MSTEKEREILCEAENKYINFALKLNLILIITHAAKVRVFDRASGNYQVVRLYTSINCGKKYIISILK
jgi:hypothetical protein